MNTSDCRRPQRTHPELGPSRFWRGSCSVWVLLVALSMSGCGGSDVPGETTTTAPSTPAPVAAAPAETAQSALARANAAFRANRIVGPTGDSALEHALTAIRLDPRNAGANEIIVDITPIAASAIEADIKAGDLTEAQRVMGLLASASPDSLIVQNLQRRLEVASRVPEPAAVAVVSSTPAAAIAATASAEPPAARAEIVEVQPASTGPVTSNAASGARQTAAEAPPVVRAQNVPAAPAAAAAQTPANPAPVATQTARPVGVSIDPVPLVRFAPEYPAAAKKRRAEGWVELQFVVGTNGVASQIEVVRAQPEGIFDRAAIRALSRWKFKPGERDGEIVEARARTTISFKLG